MKPQDLLIEGFPMPYGRPNPYGTIKDNKPRIRKYTYERPDGSIATRYEVLDSKGRRVSGQGTEGFDDLNNAKELLRRISEDQTRLPQQTQPQYTVQQIRDAIKKLQGPDQEKVRAFLKAELDKKFAITKEGQIYSTGGGAGEGRHWYKPRHVPNQNELEGVAEGGVLKSIKRGLQGWDKNAIGPGGEKLGDPKDIVRRNKAHDDETLQRLHKSTSEPLGFPFGDPNKAQKHSPLDLQKRVIDREIRKRGLGEQGVAEEQLDEKCWDTHKQVGMKSKGGKMVPNCVPKESVEEDQAPMFTPESKCPHCGGKLFEFSMMNEKKDACYYKVKSRYKVWPSAYASGALVKCRKKGASNWGTKSESSISEGLGQVDENLHQWFKEKWVRFGPDGKIRGACARGDDSEGKPKCLPQSKAHSLGKKGRASAAARKRREDPNPERSGKAINVNTKKKSNEGVTEAFQNDEANLMYRYDPASGKLKQAMVSNAQERSALAKGYRYEMDQALRMHNIIRSKFDPKKYVQKQGNKWIEVFPFGESEMSEDQAPMFTPESKGLPFPGTYEQETLPYRTKGQKRTQAIAFEDEQLEEKWSDKYKRSIDCSNPKGFSQKAHCAGRKKK